MQDDRVQPNDGRRIVQCPLERQSPYTSWRVDYHIMLCFVRTDRHRAAGRPLRRSRTRPNSGAPGGGASARAARIGENTNLSHALCIPARGKHVYTACVRVCVCVCVRVCVCVCVMYSCASTFSTPQRCACRGVPCAVHCV